MMKYVNYTRILCSCILSLRSDCGFYLKVATIEGSIYLFGWLDKVHTSNTVMTVGHCQ